MIVRLAPLPQALPERRSPWTSVLAFTVHAWMSSWQQRLGGRYNLTASLIAALVFAFTVAGLVGLAITLRCS
ncbi:hypothetical protein Rhe02_33690 [Rhizocola hellebori]|uniref:Uncharacterized protein n=1 Tax=Rhizocola hellebori TaxID=1392758 RepID=A0A8J3Q8T2_9ACTN|nr:hypothetical protein [Rhizocola hellebori]GIH05302.1 hypothetical protein Rhe02_33690 [Rhizocola hellebori]